MVRLSELRLGNLHSFTETRTCAGRAAPVVTEGRRRVPRRGGSGAGGGGTQAGQWGRAGGRGPDLRLRREAQKSRGKALEEGRVGPSL